MTLNEAFAQALSQSNITKLEMSWSMNIPLHRLMELLDGAEYTQHEELEMFRFVFKRRNKPNPPQEVPLPVPSPEKTNGI